jgi:hypothetical protein
LDYYAIRSIVMVSRYSTVLSLVTAFVAAAISSAARADHAPTLVIPGRTPAPIIVNGVDAGWAVIEGDWGLYRPGHVAPMVYGHAPALYGLAVGGYYPATGRAPRYGRHEAKPRTARRGPVPAESYFRSWSADSRPAPYYPSFDPPRVIEAPALK